MKERLREAARASLRNGWRLLEDAEILEFSEPPTTAFFLSCIAEEEFAKCFLLGLVIRGVLPWDQRLLRAARDHSCKQLLCVVMEYLQPNDEEFMARVLDRSPRPSGLPAPVVDAITILRHEKIGRWGEQRWVWAEDPAYDRTASAIADGQRDKVKQDALYVRLARDGGVASIPKDATYDSVQEERERATRLGQLAESVLGDDEHPGLDYKTIEEVFRVLFGTLESQ